MLVLSRRMGETVVIGDDIKVTVLSATGTQVRIGINAPQAVSVHREEVYKRINKDSSTSKVAAEPQQACASL